MSKGLWTASNDGITSLTVQTAGRLREGASDEFGRIWNRLFVNGAAVSSTNPLPITGGSGGTPIQIMGDIAHDSPDTAGSLPVNTGLHVVDPTALPTAVTVNDRTRAMGSLNGEALTYLSPLISGEDQTNALLGTANKKTALGTYSPSVFRQIGAFGATGEAQVKAAAGIVSSVYVHNKSGAVRYLYLSSKASAIVNGDAPTVIAPIMVAAGAAVIVGEDFFSLMGIFFATQIRVGWSSTENTFTLVNEDVVVQVNYL